MIATEKTVSDVLAFWTNFIKTHNDANMKKIAFMALFSMVFVTTAWSTETPKITSIDSTTPTEALLAKPGTYLGEKFTFEDQHSGETLVRVGVWEAGVSEIVINNFPFTEYVLMISGVVIVTDKDGESKQYIAGDTFVIPKGWSGIWDVKERMKKQIVRIGSKKLQIN